MTLQLYFGILLGYFALLSTVTGRQRWHFPKVNLKADGDNVHVDDPEKMSALWYDQAVTGLMAVMGTRLQQQLSPTSKSSQQLEQCSSKAQNSVQYARCMAPVIRQKRLLDEWRKHRQYRKNTENGRRQIRISRQAYRNFGPTNPQVEQVPPNNFEMKPVQSGQATNNFQPAPVQYEQQPINNFDPRQAQPGQQWTGQQEYPAVSSGIYPPAVPQQAQPNADKPLLVELADWLTGAVKYAKARSTSPPRVVVKKNLQVALDGENDGRASMAKYTVRDQIIQNTPVEGYVKRLFAPPLFGNSTGPKGWSAKRFASQALLSNITKTLDSFLNTHRNKNGATGPKDTLPMWQLEFLEDVQQLIRNKTNQSEHQFAQIKQQQQLQQDGPKHTVKLLSPRLLPFESDQQQYDAKFLSPDILSFTNDGIASIPKMLGATVGEASKESWLRFIMEASGVSDTLHGDPKLLETIVKSGKPGGSFQEDVKEFSKAYEQVNNKFEDSFQRLYGTFSTDQIGRMEDRGFAYLSRDQIDYIYHSEGSPCEGANDCKLDMNLDIYEKMSDGEKDEAVLDFILELANADETKREPWTTKTDEMKQRRRSKRTLVLTPVSFSPIILKPEAVSMPIILSPIMFSPIILSPSILGPIVLSPAIFSPIILSPLVLGALILSPFVGNPLILSPLVLFPIILSPLVLNPFILSPYVLTPLILDPLVLSPAILDPNVLSPLILDPGVLSPIILSPHALSPIILSPQAVSALILSPGVLSPIVKSPVVAFAIILSPQLLG